MESEDLGPVVVITNASGNGNGDGRGDGDGILSEEKGRRG